MRFVLALTFGAIGYAGTIGTSVRLTGVCPESPISSTGTNQASIVGTCDYQFEPTVHTFGYAVSASAARGDLSVASSHADIGGGTAFATGEASAWFEDTLILSSASTQEVFLSYDVLYTGYFSRHVEGWADPTVKFGGVQASLLTSDMSYLYYAEGVTLTHNDPLAVWTNQEVLFRGQIDLVTLDERPSGSLRAQLVGIHAKDRDGNDVPITMQWSGSEVIQTPEPSTWLMLLGGLMALSVRKPFRMKQVSPSE